jgi:2-polyprenyl-3-methyl-5-hydroxy-6-metoxy-1,4-benzoquinol methylase
MRRLSDNGYWNALYRGAATNARRAAWLPWCLRNYADVRLWDHLLPQLVPPGAGTRVVEIGSAPGANLVRFHQRFGCTVYGIEYAAHGCAVNRSLFRAHGIAEEQVIEADFFDAAVQQQYQDRFDVVFSQGFIEHFDEPAAVIEKHLNVLKEGGVLIVTIPNIQHMNYLLTKVFNPAVLPLHNLKIMRLPVFRALFEGLPVRVIQCGYSGVFSLDILNTPAGSWKTWLLRASKILCLPLQWLLRLVRPCRWESAALSPYFVYIGRKQAAGKHAHDHQQPKD